MNRRTMIGGLFAALVPTSLLDKTKMGDLKLGVTSNPDSFKIYSNGKVGLGTTNPTAVLYLPKFNVGDIVKSNSLQPAGQVLGVFHSSDNYGKNYVGLYKNTYPHWKGGYLYHIFYYKGTEYTTLEKFAEHSKLTGTELVEAYNKLEKQNVYTHLEEDLVKVS